MGLSALIGCATEDPLSSSGAALSHPGPWSISDATYGIGDDQYVTYTGAGLWNDGADCSGGLTPGAGIVRSYLLAHFPQTTVIGGYNCRQNTANTAYMSIHAVSRALDIMLPLSSGSADNDLGDPIGAWLIENAEVIGIQYIIWDEWTWMAARTPGQKGRMYTGPNPHHDHLHVELSAAAGARTTDWFSALVVPPSVPMCEALPAEGGVIDDVDPCFTMSGNMTYWRVVQDTGYGGSLVWTNAWTNATPSNWARWNLELTEAGDYEVEVYLTSPYAVYAATRYTVRHAAVEDTTYVDQAMETPAGSAGWVSLGVHAFAAGADQWVSVYDNVTGTVASQQHIVVDAVRLTRIGTPPPPPPPIDEAPPTVPGEPDPDADPSEAGPPPPPSRGGRCSASPHGAEAPSAAVVLASLALAATLANRRLARARSRARR